MQIYQQVNEKSCSKQTTHTENKLQTATSLPRSSLGIACHCLSRHPY